MKLGFERLQTLAELTKRLTVVIGQILTRLTNLEENGTPSSGGGQSSITYDTFTGDGSTTDFTLSVEPAGPNYCFVNVGGSGLQPNVEFSVSGTTLSFVDAPETDIEIEVRTIGDISDIGVPSAGTVGTDQLMNGSVTSEKLNLIGPISNYMASDVTSTNSDIASLRFTGVDTSKTYRICLQHRARYRNGRLQMAAFDGAGGSIIAFSECENNTSNTDNVTIPTEAIINPTSSTITVGLFVLDGATCTFVGNGEVTGTYAILQEV